MTYFEVLAFFIFLYFIYIIFDYILLSFYTMTIANIFHTGDKTAYILRSICIC